MDGDDAGDAVRPPEHGKNEPDNGYKVFTRAYDEVIHAEELCEQAELDRLRGPFGQAASEYASGCCPSCQPLAASPFGATESRLGLRLGRGHAGYGKANPCRH